jgi:hypothetical protein
LFSDPYVIVIIIIISSSSSSSSNMVFQVSRLQNFFPVGQSAPSLDVCWPNFRDSHWSMVQRFIGPLTNGAVAEGNISEGGTSACLVGLHLPLERDETPAERRIVVCCKMAGHMFTAGAERDKARE